jgi:hypothetical protein
MEMANTLDYYNTETITAIKSFIVQALVAKGTSMSIEIGLLFPM